MGYRASGWLTRLLAVVALAALGSGAASAADRSLPAGRATYRLAVRNASTDHVNYMMYVPPEGSPPAGGWPLILFLHGTEQRGDDPSMLKDLDILTFADEQGHFPFVAVVPQCPRGQQWSPSVLKQLLDAVQASVPVDRRRIYLTGFSMGGFGTWQTAAALPGTFAAIAPLCGPRDLPDVPALTGLPVWVFHGAQDRNVPLADSLAMVEALRKAGGTPRLTVYPDFPHDIWTITYRDSRLYLWFLSHSLPAGPASGEAGADDGTAVSRMAASSRSSDALLDR
ncbi:MAG TPA: prolyl oligopeptidase family serine peptidase [Spirochaetia bacterium]|nr:prolyl oligopeptidase family serine peptidase [Spirochaetia bacterium]